MTITAYDFGSIIEVIVPDETGATERVVELDASWDERDAVLEAAGFERRGEWQQLNGVYQANVEEI